MIRQLVMALALAAALSSATREARLDEAFYEFWAAESPEAAARQMDAILRSHRPSTRRVAV